MPIPLLPKSHAGMEGALGAGAGALAGGGLGLLLTPGKEKRIRMLAALVGALAGGGLTGGAGYMHGRSKDKADKQAAFDALAGDRQAATDMAPLDPLGKGSDIAKGINTGNVGGGNHGSKGLFDTRPIYQQLQDSGGGADGSGGGGQFNIEGLGGGDLKGLGNIDMNDPAMAEAIQRFLADNQGGIAPSSSTQGRGVGGDITVAGLPGARK